MTVALHVCCGPCASACVPRLKGLGHDVTMLFANSNIDTEAEFEKRKGTFMLPVIDISTINVHYGMYHFQNEKNVTLQQRGVKILCNFNNVNACSIFYGKVSVVFKSGDLYNVLVRHGRYISGYFGLYNVCVSAGDFVVPRQAVGEVYNDNEGKSMLQFQLRKETEALNPEEWFRAE